MKTRSAEMTDAEFWTKIARLLFTVCWGFVVLIGLLALAMIWTGDVRFGWTALVCVVPSAAIAALGTLTREKHDGLDYTDRRRAYQQRVRNRRSLAWLISGVLIALALVIFVVAIWMGWANLGQTGMVLLVYGVVIFFCGVDMTA